MKPGSLRVRYWAIDEAGARVDEIATVEQGADGAFARVFTTEPRAIDLALEFRDGSGWREVRARRLAPGPPRVLPGPYDRDDAAITG